MGSQAEDNSGMKEPCRKQACDNRRYDKGGDNADAAQPGDEACMYFPFVLGIVVPSVFYGINGSVQE